VNIEEVLGDQLQVGLLERDLGCVLVEDKAECAMVLLMEVEECEGLVLVVVWLGYVFVGK
jgi:hypothetical protein